ncbi:hypothetical protein O181_073595 [Austropuccinia psidii MF-1]|uniref:Uncharacterized protein n=1 Tax=Austropuccinia psidii MF-1 TaxID=1389203 RepID=A0A9Q3F2U6_9BASI|nr:hypothetical protein [Austropuccinia psidii MF-1]
MFVQPYSVRLHIFLNAQPFRKIQLDQHRAFTVSHLKQILIGTFHVTNHPIFFTLVSGRFAHDQDPLFELRASDGNFASLDVHLDHQYRSCPLFNGIISFQFFSSTHSVGSQSTTFQITRTRSVTFPNLIKPNSSFNQSPNTFAQELTRQERIAIRAQLEDPFSITSKSCFEDDSEDEENLSDHQSDVDDDLYSDDGQETDTPSSPPSSDCSSVPTSPMSSPILNSSSDPFWSCDSNKLTKRHLQQLLSLINSNDDRRETPLRISHLKLKFQKRVFEHLKSAYSSTSLPTPSSSSKSHSFLNNSNRSSKPRQLTSPSHQSPRGHPLPPIIIANSAFNPPF